MEADEETVYTYYTIVNNTVEVQETPQDENIVYFTIDNNEIAETEGEASTSNVFDETGGIDELPGYKVISLEDGGLYFTETEENLEVNQEILEEGANTVTIPEVNTEENSEEVLNDGEYQEIRFEDGIRAIIDKKLWMSLMENNSVKEVQEEEESEKKTKKYPCVYNGCNKVYSSLQHLMVHFRNHTGDRPYVCLVEGCDKSFATGYSLKAHLRTHTGETPYSCQTCTKQFKTSGDLQKHIRTHTGEKPFKCPIEGCNRSFTTSNIRKVHIRSHTGERPYVCQKEKCGKAFASATNYKNHMRIHSGEKPYVCPVADCNKRFTEYSSLYKHNMVHKPFKPFKCEYCGQRCKQESTLKAHKRAAHGLLITPDGTEIEIILNDNY
ncbi:zinc finger protein 143-like [Onthophagus taurus]|uniref:zinc finger protein 143-like n=1 Tax=Onthophagus taurus TaxID=166361 RepID=UPI0039BE439D